MVKEWTGVHSSLEEILLKINNMLGEQITAGQLTDLRKHTMHILIILTPMRLIGQYNKIDRPPYNCIYD